MKSFLDLDALAVRIAEADLAACRMVTGFDGFIDEMITLVGERTSLDNFKAVTDITAFGQMVTAAAGHNSLREIIVNAVHPGGCAVNLADGLASLGVKVEVFATLGEPPHPAFREVADKCVGFHSWGSEPGRTLAFEFNDGKLMFSSVKQLAEFTPETVRERLTDGRFAAACAAADVIALTDWTLYPNMTGVWRLLQQKVFSKLQQRPDIFIDLVDPSSRSAEDIREMAAILCDFEAGGPVTLGLNGNEANILCRLHNLPTSSNEATSEETLQQAFALRNILCINRVVIHRIPFAVSSSASDGFFQASRFCPNPKKSTGAGDRFNAGFCLGLALALGDAESLALGCAASGFFVRNARSSSHHELVNFLQRWAAGSAD